MANISIPPWIASIDPTEFANKLIAGYGQGRAAGAGRLSAEEHEIDREYDATQRAEALAAQREQAAAMMAYRQQAQAEETRQFNERQQIRQRQAELAAREASIRAEAQRGYDTAMKESMLQGKDALTAMQENFPKFAPGLLYKEPWRIPDAMQRSQGPLPPVFGTTPEGTEYAQDRRTGSMHFTPGGQKFTPRKVDVDGTPLLQVGPNQWQQLHKGPDEFSQLERARLAELNRTERRLLGNLHGLTEEEVAQEPEYAKTIDEIEALRTEKESIFAGEWKPPAKKEPNKTAADSVGVMAQRKATKTDREEATALMKQFPKKADAIRARFKKTFGEDL